MMHKLSVRHHPSIRKISKRESEGDVIKRMKESIKKDPSVIEKFKKYDVSLDEIDDMHVEFCELDVSAKTKSCKVYLNEKMLDSGSDVKDPTHYLAHEAIHFLQQLTGNTQGHDEVDDYLSKPTEVEAFQVQVDFKDRNEGEDEADEYLEELLSHHDKDGQERKEIKRKLKDNK